VPILKLDTKVARGQNFDHAPLKFYVLFSSHRRDAEATRLALAGQIENSQSRIAPSLR